MKLLFVFGLSAIVAATKCGDLKDENIKCPGWKKFCKYARNQNYMEKNCAKSCCQREEDGSHFSVCIIPSIFPLSPILVSGQLRVGKRLDEFF